MKILNNFIEKYKGKKVLIVGLGKSGLAAMEVLDFVSADVFVYDSKNKKDIDEKIKAKYGKIIDRGYFGEVIPASDDWDFIVMSPGVPPSKPFILNAKNKGATLTGDLELGFEAGCSNFIAITGTNGKTTTTTLVGEIFAASGIESEVTGNIGRPIIESVTATGRADNMVFITEVSSFQLETIDTFTPHIAAFLNLTPDHLDRHGTFSEYGRVKARIFENQTDEDYLIYNYDDTEVRKIVEAAKSILVPFSIKEELDEGVYAKNGEIIIAERDGKKHPLIAVSEVKMPGNHNLENALASVAIAISAGIDASVIAKKLKEFTGVEHRMELVCEIDGVRYVNDSKGTNPNASQKAIDATEKDIILIAGGYNKNSDFHEFIRSFDGKVKTLVLLGDTAEIICETAKEEGFENVVICSGMEECVNYSKEHAISGDTVLLSPASASWDMYKSYEERGEHFKRLVRG